jgi:hypothetical protein
MSPSFLPCVPNRNLSLFLSTSTRLTLPLFTTNPSTYPKMFSRLATTAIRRAAPAARVAPSASVLSSARFAPIAIRSYAGGPDIMSKTGVEARVLDIFRTFDKVNQDKVRLPSFEQSEAVFHLSFVVRKVRRRPSLALS